MASQKKSLTAAFVKSASDGTHTDDKVRGLTLRVAKGGSQKSWVLRLTEDGKRKNIGLGGYPKISLAEARKAALAIRDGKEPETAPVTIAAAQIIAAPVAVATATAPTFWEYADRWIAEQRATWTNERHATQWTESLTIHAYPHIGLKPIDQITRDDVRGLFLETGLWYEKHETARKLQQRISKIFRAAVWDGLAPFNPCDGLVERLPKLPAVKEHHPAPHYTEVPAALESVRQSTADDVTRKAFEFLVLTAVRTGSVRAMTWQQVDLETGVWEIPVENDKMRRGHPVPLSQQAVAVLKWQNCYTRGKGLVFPNARTGKPLSDAVFQQLVKRLAIPSTTPGKLARPHGFRSSFRNWAAEMGYDERLAETALSHVPGDASVQAYHRTQLIEQRRPMMEAWADYLINS